jgi:Stage II sporulation protein E (SpoIIE)
VIENRDQFIGGSGSASPATPGERLLLHVTAASHVHEPDRTEDLAREAAQIIGGRDCEIYVVDASQEALVRLGCGEPGRTQLSIDGTLPGRAFRDLAIVAASPANEGAGRRLWAPVLDGADRCGVIGVTFDEDNDWSRRYLAALAALVASLLLSKSALTDCIVRSARLRPMDLAAELRWALLPPLTCRTPQVVVAGILEPAYDIAGDAFDYALSGTMAQVAIFDAVGHGLEASRLANLAIASYRHSRRTGVGLVDTYEAMDEVITDQFGDSKFVTGQLAELELATGRLQWLNAGHPQPLRLRTRAVRELDADVLLPLGLATAGRRLPTDKPAELRVAVLEPGDGVLFFSDGVIESRSVEGDEFGIERLTDLLARTPDEERPAETARRLMRAVLDHSDGRLRDDATLLLLRWVGPGTSTRESTALDNG